MCRIGEPARKLKRCFPDWEKPILAAWAKEEKLSKVPVSALLGDFVQEWVPVASAGTRNIH
jgi:hypothetical protein